MGSRFLGLADRLAIERLLVEYVGVHSVNPGIDAGPGEAALVSAVEARLRELGLETSRQEVAPNGRDNIVATLRGAEGSPTVLFEAHLDTVGLSGSATTQVVLDGGNVYGRGACDTKGSLVAMLEAVRLLAATEREERPNVMFAGTIDEEFAGTGAARLVEDDTLPTMAVVGEPTALDVAIAHKGVLRFRIATHGVPAHSSKPHLGVNAINAMAPVLRSLEEVYLPTLERIAHPLVGSPTLSVSTIMGGTAENVVPAECVISIDRRVNPGESHEEILARIDDLVAAMAQPGAAIVREEPTLATAALDTPPDHRLVEAMGRARLAILGDRGKPSGMTFGTDASFFAPAGIPCVVFGPGSIDQAHSDEEWVGVEETARASEILAEAMLCLRPGPVG